MMRITLRPPAGVFVRQTGSETVLEFPVDRADAVALWLREQAERAQLIGALTSDRKPDST